MLSWQQSVGLVSQGGSWLLRVSNSQDLLRCKLILRDTSVRVCFCESAQGWDVTAHTSPTSGDVHRLPDVTQLPRGAESKYSHTDTGKYLHFSPAPISRPGRVSPAGPPVHALLHEALVGLGVALLAHELRGVHARAVARHHVTTSWVSAWTHGCTKNLPRNVIEHFLLAIICSHGTGSNFLTYTYSQMYTYLCYIHAYSWSQKFTCTL